MNWMKFHVGGARISTFPHQNHVCAIAWHHTQWLSTYLSSIIPHYRRIPFFLIVLLRRTFTKSLLYRENVVARLVSLKAVPLLWVLTSRWITAYVDTRYSSIELSFVCQSLTLMLAWWGLGISTKPLYSIRKGPASGLPLKDSQYVVDPPRHDQTLAVLEWRSLYKNWDEVHLWKGRLMPSVKGLPVRDQGHHRFVYGYFRRQKNSKWGIPNRGR